ncbi:fasciclin domain-containing protein [Mycolicibacterium sp.]|uniref:fasciclin domain-containing protein n=1 Tax=Mycolicibacterium sp. TaxID=2320850 RepID=UPI001A2EF821|nr:fasciclin domain-containing protein [Mycolicibacterium sp.]MBJ7337768.1 fasciclin domain-containing protein [Mycolicibacterium sp.]
MKTRTSRAIGVSAAIAAIAVSVPLAVTAQADPTPTETAAAKPLPDWQGNCDPVRTELAPSGATKESLAKLPVGQALAQIPSLSTFTSAINGGLDPAVNIVPVLENGPYVVFAPNNDAFAKLDPTALETLKTDPAALSKLDYYHVFLGLLGPGDVAGQRPTQQGAEIKVTGKDGDIKVNDTAKVLCGGIQAANARIYILDTVLDPNSPPEPLTPKTSFEGTGKPLTPTSITTAAPAPAPAG